MKELEQAIETFGHIIEPDILKVDAFLNHQVNPKLMRACANTFAQKFSQAGITKVVTIESSGIAPALYTAELLDVPMVFARKKASVTMNEEVLQAEVFSFTKKTTNRISIEKRFISADDTVLIIDDFLANGQAVTGLIDMIETQAKARVAGVGIVIEKAFQPGRKLLEDNGVTIVSLARIQEFVDGHIVFAQADA